VKVRAKVRRRALSGEERSALEDEDALGARDCDVVDAGAGAIRRLASSAQLSTPGMPVAALPAAWGARDRDVDVPGDVRPPCESCQRVGRPSPNGARDDDATPSSECGRPGSTIWR
jgi:hypothetical protein